MSYHKLFLFNRKEKLPFTEKNLVHRNQEDQDRNREINSQIESNKEHLTNLEDIEAFKNKIAELSIEDVELTRGNSLFNVLSTSIANLPDDNGSINNEYMAIEILDGLIDNGKITIDQARAPWRDFDKLSVTNGQLVLSKKTRIRGNETTPSYREVVSVNLPSVPSDALTRIIAERELEERQVDGNTNDLLTDVITTSLNSTTSTSTRPATRRTSPDQTPPSVQRSAPRTIQQAENDTTETVRSLSTQSEILDAIDNISSLTNFNLPEEFQRGFTSRQFRSLMTSGRISNSEEIIQNLNQLGISADQFESTLGYGNRNNLEAGLSINAGEFLQSSEYQDETLQQFLRTTLILEQIPNKTEEQTLELNNRRETFQIINRTVEILKNIELREVTNENRESQALVNPDYIRRFDISREISRELGNILLETTERNLISIIILTYGPLENLIQNGVFNIEQLGDNTNRRRTTYRINLNSLEGIDLDALRRIIAKDPTGDTLICGSVGSLTRTMNKISEMPELMEQIRTEQFSLLSPTDNAETSDSDTVYQHLRYMFNIENTGMLSRNGNRSLTQFDTLGGESVRVRESNYINQRLSDRQMYQYLLGSCLERTNGRTQLSLSQFNSRITQLIELGTLRIQFDPSLTIEERQEIVSSSLNFEFNSSEPLDNNIISLIKYGIIAESNIDTIDSLPILTESERATAMLFQEQGVPPDEANRLARASVGFLANFDAQRIVNRDGIGAGAYLNIPLGAKRNPNGTYELVVPANNGPININENTTGRTVVNLGLGSSLNLPEQSGRSFGDVGIMVGITTEVSERTTFATSASIRPMSISAGLELSTEVNQDGVEIGLQIAGGSTFLGLPFISAGVFAGRSIEANVDNAIDRADNNLQLELPDIDPSVWRSLNENRLNASQILELADQIPGIQEIVDKYNETNPAMPEDNAKIFVMHELAKSIVNSGIENTRGIGFTVGVGISTVSGLAFGKIEFIIARQRYASVDQTQLDSLGIAGIQAINSINQTSTDYITNVQIDGIDSTYDPISGTYRTSEQTYNPDKAITFATSAQAIETLNESSSNNGLIFESRPDGSFYFTLSDYSSNLARYGLNQTTDIFIDPATGFKITPSENGEFQIQFGTAPNALPPNDLNIIFQRVTNSHGRQSGTNTAITFSRGDNPETAESLYLNPTVNTYLHIDNRGQAVERNNSTHFESNVVWRPLQDRMPTITESDLISYKESSTTIFDLVSANLDENGLDSEALAQLESFYEQAAKDTEFLRSLARATTISIENGEHELDTVYELITSKWTELFPGTTTTPTFSGNDILAMAATLIPDTFLNLQRVSENRRLSEVIRVAQDVSTRYVTELLKSREYNDNNGTEFTQEEQTRLVNIISALATQKANEIAPAIVAGTASVAEIDNFDSMFTTAGLRRMGVEGFRNFMFSETNRPEIITGSQAEFNESDPDQALAIQFINNLYEPAIQVPTELIENLDTVRTLLNSPTSIELLGSAINVGNINEQISLVSLLYTPEEFKIFSDLMEQILNGEHLTELTDRQGAILTHYLNTITTVRDGDGQATKFGTNELIFTLDSVDSAGYMFLANCGNLTFYNNRTWSTPLLNNEGFSVNTGSGENLSTTNYDVNYKTFSIGLSANFRGRQEETTEPDKPDEPLPPPPERTPDKPDAPATGLGEALNNRNNR